MSEMKYLIGKNGEAVMPITSVNAVRDESGNTLNTLLTPESLGNGIGICSTSAETLAKEVDIEGYKITQNGFVSITFENDVPSGSTLNINSQGAKPIYHKNAPIEDDVISSGDTVLFGYDGSHYVVSSLGGGSVNLSETVEINLEQIGGYNEDLIDATITITDLDTSTTLLSTTWQGSIVTLEIEPVTNYKVEVGNVVGYITPSSQQYISKPGRILDINFKYTGVGAYVEATDGTIYRSSEWTSAGKTANSVVILDTSHSVRIAIQQSFPIRKVCAGWGSDPRSYCTLYGTYNAAAVDFNGTKNTQDMMRWNTAEGVSSSDSASMYCNSYVFPDGITRGILPSMGQWLMFVNNNTSVNSCLSVCNGKTITDENYTVSGSQFYNNGSTTSGFWLSTVRDYDSNTWNHITRGGLNGVDYYGAGSMYGGNGYRVCIFGEYN